MFCIFLLLICFFCTSLAPITTVEHTGQADWVRVFCEKIGLYVWPILLFLSYSYVKSQFDYNSHLSIYKTILAIRDTPRQTQCVRITFFRTSPWCLHDCGLNLLFVFCSKLWMCVCLHVGIIPTSILRTCLAITVPLFLKTTFRRLAPGVPF